MKSLIQLARGTQIVAFLAAVALSACTASAPPDDSETPVSSQRANLSTVGAGESGLRLGVFEWQFDQDSGLIDGTDASGKVVAQFFVDVEGREIQALLPSTGQLSIIDARKSSMPEDSLRYWTALRDDLEVAVKHSGSGELAVASDSGEKAQWRSCWGYELGACNSYGAWLLVNGYITGWICQYTDWCGGQIGLAY